MSSTNFTSGTVVASTWLNEVDGHVFDEHKEVNVARFGAVGDGVTDDTAAVQAAINYCATFTYWPKLIINGRTKITSSLTVNRPVDASKSEFIIEGRGPGAGFYTTGNVTLFTSSISMTTDPVSEFITFKDLTFESSSYFNNSYVLSAHFLRIKFENCFFFLIRCMISSLYAQTIYFLDCNIRNNPPNFINVQGTYDVSFNHCIIENGNTILRSVDVARGVAGTRFLDCVIEGIQASIAVLTGCAGFSVIDCHLESNFSPEFNFFAGSLTNSSITFINNYIYNPSGATCYYGPSTNVVSLGNTVFPSVFHSNAGQITTLVSTADKCDGGVSDATTYSVINGIYRAGSAEEAWTHSASHFVKTTAGEFGIGAAPISGVRQYIRGQNTTSSNYALVVANSLGNDIALFRNDRVFMLPALGSYANDAAAAAGGVPIGGTYRNGSDVKVRVT